MSRLGAVLPALVVVLVTVGCGGMQASPVAPTVIRETVFVGPPSTPTPPPPGPHFALELAASNGGPVTAGAVWSGVVTVTAAMAILRPELPVVVSATCGTETKALPGFSSGSAPFSCLLPEGTHTVTARAQMADGRVYATGMTVAILAAPVAPPTPAPPAPPTRQPTVEITAYEVRRDTGAARWRLGADGINGTLASVEWDFGPGADPEEATTDGDDRMDVDYDLAGIKEIRWRATFEDGTIRTGRPSITVTFRPAPTP